MSPLCLTTSDRTPPFPPKTSAASNNSFASIIFACTTAMRTSMIINSQAHSMPFQQTVSLDLPKSANDVSNSFIVMNNCIITPELNCSLATLREIAALQPNWNGNDAECFSQKLIDFTASVLERLPIQPGIYPTGRDSIQLEFENQKGDYLEFELFDGPRVKMFIMEDNGQHSTKFIDPQNLAAQVGDFYG